MTSKNGPWVFIVDVVIEQVGEHRQQCRTLNEARDWAVKHFTGLDYLDDVAKAAALRTLGGSDDFTPMELYGEGIHVRVPAWNRTPRAVEVTIRAIGPKAWAVRDAADGLILHGSDGHIAAFATQEAAKAAVKDKRMYEPTPVRVRRNGDWVPPDWRMIDHA